MQRLEVSGAVRPLYGSLGFKGLIWEKAGPCPIFASYTLAFALELRKRHGKPSVRVDEECQLARWK